MRGEQDLVRAVDGPLDLETWEVIGRLAAALGVEGLPETYDKLVEVVRADMKKTAGSAAVAGSTPASLASRIDRALGTLLEGVS